MLEGWKRHGGFKFVHSRSNTVGSVARLASCANCGSRLALCWFHTQKRVAVASLFAIFFFFLLCRCLWLCLKRVCEIMYFCSDFLVVCGFPESTRCWWRLIGAVMAYCRLSIEPLKSYSCAPQTACKYVATPKYSILHCIKYTPCVSHTCIYVHTVHTPY